MEVNYAYSQQKVHRRTGGLEKKALIHIGSVTVHRRTGGLERFRRPAPVFCRVHRRTGGLEISK